MKLSLNPELIQEKFFFAANEAKYYDDTIGLTVPYYQLIHQTMIDILSYHFGVNYSAKNKNIKGIVLDVGAGTGKESISVMSSFPKLHTLAIDLCEPMKDIFEKNYQIKFGRTSKPRYKYIVDDVLTISEGDGEVQKYYSVLKQQGCKAAISAYCIHHFPLEEKKVIYKKMYDFLEPGGILINMDLFNYESEVVKFQAHHFDLEYIKREFDNPGPQFKKSRKIPEETRVLLKKKWLSHMNNDNILDSVESQIQILNDIGFKDVECIFKYWQQGVIRGVK